MSLPILRIDPLTACTNNAYRTGPSPGSFNGQGAIVEGGRCTIASMQLAPRIFQLTATAAANAGTDYFYPWLQRGIGWARVPRNVPNGTIVMTGGVNGCTLVVTEFMSDYYFYHDGDSSHLYRGLTTGREVARVAPRDYDPFDRGRKAFESELSTAASRGVRPAGDVSYGHFVLAIKNNGRFGMYATGLTSLNGLSILPPAITPCIVTF
jgi:hypothetical protein